MTDSMIVYIENEELRSKAEEIIEDTKKATDCDEDVNISVVDKSGINWTNSNSGTLTIGTTTPTPTITTTNISPYWSQYGGGSQYGTYTPSTTAQPQITYYPLTIPAPATPLGPINVESAPKKEHFEKMVRNQIQALNDAYLLGHAHGRLAGLKEGQERITKTVDDIMDTEILIHDSSDKPSAAL